MTNFLLFIFSEHCPFFLLRSTLYTKSKYCYASSKFFSPTDAQLDSLKNKFKFALKLTLKGSYMFRCETPSSGSILSEAQIVCSLTMVFFTPKHVGAF